MVLLYQFLLGLGCLWPRGNGCVVFVDRTLFVVMVVVGSIRCTVSAIRHGKRGQHEKGFAAQQFAQAMIRAGWLLLLLLWRCKEELPQGTVGSDTRHEMHVDDIDKVIRFNLINGQITGIVRYIEHVQGGGGWV